MKRLKDAICTALELADTYVLRHAGGCALLNQTAYLWYDEERDDFRFEVPNPIGRFYLWALDIPKYEDDPE